jgi:GAF domain-containing protein
MSTDVVATAPRSRRALDRFALSLSDLTAAGASPSDVLGGVAEGCTEAFDAALSRVWLLGPGDACSSCALRDECADRSRCLHLEVSAGITRNIDGPWRRFPVGARRVGQTAVTLEPYIVRGDLSPLGLAEPSWLAAHAVRGFAALPLIAPGGLIGVLALFTRREWSDADAAALALAARLSANAVAAARSFAALRAARDPTSRGDTRATAAGEDTRHAESAAFGTLETDVDAAHLRPMDDLERDAIVRVLDHTGWRVSGPRGAAVILGLPPSTLASRMIRLGIRRPPRG